MLKNSMDRLTHTCIFLEEFDKEDNQVVIKYIPYRKKVE